MSANHGSLRVVHRGNYRWLATRWKRHLEHKRGDDVFDTFFLSRILRSNSQRRRIQQMSQAFISFLRLGIKV